MGPSKLHTPTVRERILSGTDDITDLGAPVGLGSRATSFYERTQENSTFRPLTAGGIRQSIFVLVQTSLGGGILTIAYMMRLSGVLLGTFLLFSTGWVAYVSMDVLMKCAVKQHRYTLGSLMSCAFGQGIGVALDLMLFLYGNGSLITYFIFLGDFIPTIFEGLSQGTYSEHDRDELRTRCLVGALLLVMGASLPRDLSGLRFLSPVMAIGILYTEVVVVKCCISNWHSEWSLEDLEDDFRMKKVELCNLDGFVQAFSLCVFSYVCHLNVTPVAKELANPEDRRIEKISFRVAFVQFLIYLILAVGGYLTFGDKTAPNLLTNYAADDPWILASRIGLTFTILVAVATNTNPTVRACLCLLEEFFPSIKEPTAEGLKTQPFLETPQTPPLIKRNLLQEPQCRRYLRYFLSISCLTMDTMIAICVKDVASVVGFLGATMGTLMMMVIPGLLVYKMEVFSICWSRCIIFLFVISAALNCFAVFH